MDPSRVARRFLVADTLLSEEWVETQLRTVRELTTKPVDGSDFEAIIQGIEDLSAYMRGIQEHIERASNFHPYFAKELDWDNNYTLDRMVKPLGYVVRDYKELVNQLKDRPKTSLWDFTELVIRAQYKKDVKTVVDASRFSPNLWQYKTEAVLQDVESKIPDGIDHTSLNPQLVSWLKTKKVKDRIFRVGMDRSRYTVDPLGTLTMWFNDLRTKPRTDELYQDKGAYREVSIGKATLVLLDPQMEVEFDAASVKAIEGVYRNLQQAGLGAVWYGPLFYVSKDNPKLTGKLLELAKNMGYDIQSYGGRYNHRTDLVVTSGYPENAASTLTHELGHRYWYKFMKQEQRERFQNMVRTRPAVIEEGNEAKKKYLEEMDYLPGEINDDGDLKPILPVSEYGGTNIAEAFAEVFSHYVQGKKMTRDQRVSFKWIIGH